MDVGMIGLGRMGGHMAERLLAGGHRVVANTRRDEVVRAMEEKGAVAAYEIPDLVRALPKPRAIWIMVTAGAPVDQVIETLVPLLDPGDIIVDGGNSYYKDTLRRGRMLAEKKIHFVDSGTSGGIWGLTEGYCMMVGGPKDVVDYLRPAFDTLAPSADKGWGHVGPTGAGHFVKMVHNGIEYGLMQAYAEGFAVMKGKEEFGVDLAQVAEIWRFGSVIRSWLLDLATDALKEDADLADIAPYVADSGEGRWTAAEAIELGVSTPVMTLSLFERFRSRDEFAFGDRLLAVLRNRFGGHPMKKEPGNE